MSTNRDVPTLPLDALRSLTPQRARHQAQRPFGGNKSQSFSNSVSDQNVQLCVENQKLRRCLSLFVENSSLKTANILSTVISMCDDNLRNFMTEKIKAPSANSTAASFRENSNSSQQLKRSNEAINDTSVSYGMSFQQIDLNELGNNTFEMYENRSTKSTSPRRSYSPASQSGSLRPPMRFGVGKSPYKKSPVSSPVARSFSPSSHNSSVLQGHGQHIFKSKPKSKTSKSDKSSNNAKSPHVDLINETSTTKRPSSVPHIRKMLFDNGEFKVNKNSAFSQVKGKQQCKDCSLMTPHLCSFHSTSSEKYFPNAVVGRSPTENSLPVYINAKPQLRSITQNRSPSSNYQTAQHLLYDSQGDYHNEFISENQTNPPIDSTIAGKTIKRHLAKSVNWTQDPNYFKVKNSSVPNKDDYNRSTQSSFGKDLKLTELQLEDGFDRKFPVRDTIPVQGSPVQRGTPLQTPLQQTTGLDMPEVIGTPQAASTPVPTTKQQHTFQRQGDVLNNESLAHVIGLKGPGSAEKAQYILHRPLDILIDYHPEVPEEAIRSLTMSKPSKRILGELAFQLDRRILENVFAGKNDQQKKRRSRYYGYSVASISMLITKEAQRAGNDPDLYSSLRARLEHIFEALQPLSYDVEHHSEFTQDIVNKYGLSNGTPQPDTVEDIALREPAVMRLLVGQLVTDEQELYDMLIILDCLHFMAHQDKGPLFTW